MIFVKIRPGKLPPAHEVFEVITQDNNTVEKTRDTLHTRLGLTSSFPLLWIKEWIVTKTSDRPPHAGCAIWLRADNNREINGSKNSEETEGVGEIHLIGSFTNLTKRRAGFR
jgi:hypothetical protein